MDAFSLMDIVAAVIFVSLVWKACGNTLFVEIFNLLSALFAVVISLHFYPRFASYLGEILLFKSLMPDLLAFLVLFWGITFIFFLAREGWMILMKIDPKLKDPLGLSVWVSLFTAGLVAGQVLIAGLLSNNSYISQSFQQSLTGRVLAAYPLRVYQGAYEVVIKKIDPDEKINEPLIILVQTASEKNVPEEDL